MTEEEILNTLQVIFGKYLNLPQIQLTFNTTAHDVPGWDSFNHVQLITLVEDHFDVQIPLAKLIHLQNIGDLVLCVESILQKNA